MSSGRRGLLLVLEGPEGVGKTTQVAALVRRLQRAGLAARTFREPGGTPLGDEIRALVLGPDHPDVSPRAEALLFMAARAQLARELRARLEAREVVVLDRFFLSTYAYQIVGRGLPADEVRSANALAVDGLVPDLTLLLACDDPEVARARMLARGGLDRMEQESADFHARVTDAFLAAADPSWQRAHPEVGPVARVDAGGTPEEVTARILAALEARWPETFGTLAESQ
jgi:dTMP kinase